jgi:hypothetical protein
MHISLLLSMMLATEGDAKSRTLNPIKNFIEFKTKSILNKKFLYLKYLRSKFVYIHSA